MPTITDPTGLQSWDIVTGVRVSGSTGSYTYIPGLQQIPDLGNTASSKERIDVTTLNDHKRRYISGVADEEDPGSIEFTYLYSGASGATISYSTLVNDFEGKDCEFKVEFPKENAAASAGAQVSFNGMPFFRINSVGVNEAVTFTMSVATSYDASNKVYTYTPEA